MSALCHKENYSLRGWTGKGLIFLGVFLWKAWLKAAVRSPKDYDLWNMKFASETRLFMEGSQVHLNCQKHIIRRKTYWLLDVAWKDRKMANWMTQNYPLAHWAVFNSGQHSVPKENKHGGRQILRCVPKLGYMLLENLHHPFSLISCLLLHKRENN